MRVSEVYLSVQGEGPRVGKPTVFVRFAGCNLRCPGWPCDTPHAIDPAKYRHEWQDVTSGRVVEMVLDQTSSEFPNICFTGGEPFLQNHEELELIVDALAEEGYTTFEVFTNGTIDFPEWHTEHLHVVMDWKLTGSGEIITGSHGMRFHEARMRNLDRLDAGDAVKFTIKDRQDYEEAKVYYEDYAIRHGSKLSTPTFFYGPVWGKIQPKQLVEWVLEDELDWQLNIQVHNIVFDRNERGI